MTTPFIIGFIVGAAAMFAVGAMAVFIHFYREEISRQVDIYREQDDDAPAQEKPNPKPKKKNGKKGKRKRAARPANK